MLKTVPGIENMSNDSSDLGKNDIEDAIKIFVFECTNGAKRDIIQDLEGSYMLWYF